MCVCVYLFVKCDVCVVSCVVCSCIGLAEKQRGKKMSTTSAASSDRLISALDECQFSSSAAAHRRLAKLIAPLRNASLAEDLIRLLRQSILTRFKREQCVERIVRFVVALTVADGGHTEKQSKRNTSSDDDDDEEEEVDEDVMDFTESILSHLVTLCRCADKAVRFRSCQIIAGILNGMSQEAEVSDEVWESIQEVMLERLADKAPPVRLQAVRALARLQEADDEGDFSRDEITLSLQSVLATERNKDVRKAVLASLAVCDHTLEGIVSRTADVNDDVRRVAFIIISGKVPFDVLSISQRIRIVTRGLNDREKKVRVAAMETFERWMSHSGGGTNGLLKVIEALDVESNEAIVEKFIKELIKSEHLTLQDMLTKLNRDCSLNKNRKSDEYDFLISSEQALCWRVVSGILKDDAQNRGSAAAHALGTGAVIEAAAAVEKLDLLDRNLPRSVSDFIMLIRHHLKHSRFSAWQLIRMAPCLELSDTASREALKHFLVELLGETPVPFDDGSVGSFCLVGAGGEGKWERSVVETLAAVVTDINEWTCELMNALSDIYSNHLTSKQADHEASSWWVQALVWTSLTLERAPSSDVFSSSSIQLEDINNTLVVPCLQHTSPIVRQYAVQVLGLLCCIDKNTCLNNIILLKAVIDSCEEDNVKVEAIHALCDICLLRGDDDMGDDANDNKNSIEDTLLDVLTRGCDGKCLETLAEGLAKLLIFEQLKDPSRVLKELLLLYISSESTDSSRLQQCLAVFFAAYATSSVSSQKIISATFLPAVRIAMSADKKSAVLLIKFLHQLAQSQLSNKSAMGEDSNITYAAQRDHVTLMNDLLCEVIAYPKTAITASYISALTKVISTLSMNMIEADGLRMSVQLLRRAIPLIDAPTAAQDLQNAVNHCTWQLMSSTEKEMSTRSEEDCDYATPRFDDEEIFACDAFLSGFESRIEKQNGMTTSSSQSDDDTNNCNTSKKVSKKKKKSSDTVKKKQKPKISTGSQNSNDDDDKSGADDCFDENVGDPGNNNKNNKIQTIDASTTRRRSSRTRRGTLEENNSIAIV